VTAAEFAVARRTLGWTDDEVAAELDVSTAVVRAWAAGDVAVPRRHARQLVWQAAIAERQAVLRESGLPECAWLRTHLETIPDDAGGMERHARATAGHLESCEVCRAHERYEAEHCGPLPPPPGSAWFRVFQWIERVPAWARPAVVGAAILMGIVLLRMLFLVPALMADPGRLGEVALAIVAAGGAGAVGGLAYSLTRPSLRKLGVAGAYLTGIVCVFAYMGALALAAPLAFGERIIEEWADLVIFAVVSLFFGLVMGHSWFRDPDVM